MRMVSHVAKKIDVVAILQGMTIGILFLVCLFL